MKGRPRRRKVRQGLSQHCAAEGFSVFALLDQKSGIQGSTNSHGVVVTLAKWGHPGATFEGNSILLSQEQRKPGQLSPPEENIQGKKGNRA